MPIYNAYCLFVKLLLMLIKCLCLSDTIIKISLTYLLTWNPSGLSLVHNNEDSGKIQTHYSLNKTGEKYVKIFVAIFD